MDMDLVHIGVTLGGVALTVAILKTDLKWIKAWMHEHKEEHRSRDEDIEKRLRAVELCEFNFVGSIKRKE